MGEGIDTVSKVIQDLHALDEVISFTPCLSQLNCSICNLHKRFRINDFHLCIIIGKYIHSDNNGVIIHVAMLALDLLFKQII
jgi:hypothetical protein